MEIDQIVYSLAIGNTARQQEELSQCRIIKIGRKYFTVRRCGDNTGWTDTQYSIKDMSEKTEYSPRYRLYLSKQDFYDEKESREICKKIYKAFEYGCNRLDIKLDNLRKINQMLSSHKIEQGE